jgi:hypothetical protein
MDFTSPTEKKSVAVNDVESGHVSLDANVGYVDEVPRYQVIQQRFGPLRHLGHFERQMDKRLGVESQGIDRIREDERKPPSLLNAVLMWYSLNLHVASLPVGFLGPELGLSFGMSCAAVILGVFTGALLPAFAATLGPKVR